MGRGCSRLRIAAAGFTAASTYHGAAPALLFVLAAVGTLPLAVRCLYPVPVLAVVVAVATVVGLSYTHGWWPFAAIVALYTVAAHCPRRTAISAGAAALLVLAAPIVYQVDWSPLGWNDVALVAGRFAPLVAAWLLGGYVRARREYTQAVEERAAQLEREQEANARRAAAEEQARIAREVHDVVAHNLSVIIVQATAADEVWSSDPEDARRAVRTIGSTARRALDELRHVLGTDHEQPSLAPQPTLSGLEDLLEQVRAAGLEVELEVVGEQPRAVAGARALRLPDRAGGAHQHAAARRRRARDRDAPLRPGRGDRRGPRRRIGATVHERRQRARPDRHARTRRDLRRPGRGRTRRRRRLPRHRPAAALLGRAMTIRVLLCDDQALVRDGFRMILNAQEGIEVVAEAGDGAEAVELTKRLLPHVVLMDVRMPGMNGIEATRRIVLSGVESRVLILTTFDLDEYVYEALRAGASGFLLKDVTAAQLVEGVRVVAAGESMLAPTVTRRLLERFAGSLPGGEERTPPSLQSLTEREREILTLLASGLSNAELGARLYLSEPTIKTHLSSIFRKLGVRDRVQAVIAAYDAGLVEPAPAARLLTPSQLAVRTDEAPGLRTIRSYESGFRPPTEAALRIAGLASNASSRSALGGSAERRNGCDTQDRS